MGLGSPDYRGPQLAHAPGTVLDLLEWAPILLPPEEISHYIGRLPFEVRRGLETYEGRRAFVEDIADGCQVDGCGRDRTHYHMAAAGLVAVALLCPLFANIPDGSWVGC